MLGSNLRRAFQALAPTAGALACAQTGEIERHIPYLYLILTGNALLLALTHLHCAPLFLSVLMPVILAIISLLRVLASRRRRRRPVDGAGAVRRLRRTTLMVFVNTTIFTAWSLSLFNYGGAYDRCHVAFYMAITTISMMFCLRHAPRAVVVLAATVIGPFMVAMLGSGQPALCAIAINLLLVTGSILFALLQQFTDFADLVSSREQLLERQRELERLSDENLRLANQDSLTSLPNRRSFFAALEEWRAAALERSGRIAAVMIDLDGFKTVNDVHGHGVGDRLLVEAAERLRALVGPEVFVARLGGDEFAAILRGERSDQDLLATGETICRALTGRYLASEMAVFISASVGIVSFPDRAQTTEQLFERADFALYHAKQTCKGRAVLFSATHESMIREASLIQHTLEQADLEGEVRLVFQPIVDTETGELDFFEALARWQSPVLGAVRPDVFIRAAERSRTVGALTEILFRKALDALAAWPEHVRLAFNLSALDVDQPERIDTLLRLVAASGAAPGRIDLEITETAMMRDLARALASVRRLREAGFRISLDDFGTGYSSLSQLHVLKPDKVKIDRSFVVELETRPESCDVVRTTVELCRNIGSDIVIEGVETARQRDLLRALGGQLMQGYLFSRPLEWDAANRLIDATLRGRARGLAAGTEPARVHAGQPAVATA